MKTVIMKKAAAMATAILMAFTVTPSVAFANTWGDGDTDEESKSTVVVDYEPLSDEHSSLPDKYASPRGLYTIKFKAGKLQPFTFYNAYEEIGTRKPDHERYNNPYEEKLTEKKKKLFAKYQLKDWSRIATKIFSSQSQVGGEGGMSGVTWDGPTWAEALVTDWSDMFEIDDLDDIVRINLPDWLCKEDHDEISRNDETAYTRAVASGIQSADSLAAVRNSLISGVADLTERDSGYFENRDNEQGKTLSALDDDTSRDVYYSHVLWQGNEGSTNYFNCYGIALYDFQYIPIEGDGLRYSYQAEQLDDNEGRNKVISPLSTLVNEDTSDKNMEVTLEGQRTQIQQNVLGWDEREECSYAYADRFPETFKDTWPVGYYDVKEFENFHSALETTREAGKKMEYQTSESVTVSPIVPAHTLLQVNEMKNEYTYNMMYAAASSLRYKVSIFSLTGSIGEADEVDSCGDFCTEFGAEGAISVNDDANSNLYERAVKGAVSDDALARTEGYYKGNRLTDGVDWTHEAFNENVVLGDESHPVVEVIQDRATRLPMAEVSMVLDLINTVDQQELGATVPLYYLSKFELSDGVKSEYPMRMGSSYPIDGLSVVGKNEYDVVYSGFKEKTDQNMGSWKVATKDPEGNPLDSGVVTISKNPNTGKQKIEAKKAGIAYLTWELKEEKDGEAIKFTSADNKTVSATENPPKYPYVKIQVMDESAIPSAIGFDPDLPDSIDGIAEESINLYTTLPVNVVNKNGEVIDHSCVYKFENKSTAETDASIDEHGNFIAHKPGDYRIKAEYSGVDILTTTTEENKTIKVQAARKVTLIPVGGSGKMNPDKDGAFSLKGSVTYEDQYGEPWTGNEPDNKPTLTYTLTGSAKCGNDLDEVSRKAKIWDDQLVVDHNNIGDGDTFHIKAKVKGDTGVEPVSFDYVVEGPLMADIPVAVSGLVFNGKAQAGVKSGKGYTLKGETAVDAGWYEATATLDGNYKYWSDGSTDPARTVRYYIDKAANPLKLKGKTAKVKYSKLKKKNQSIKGAKAITVTGPQGAVTYEKSTVTYTKAKSVKMSKKALKKYGKKAAKKISINKNTGKITVRKGLKKGTYKVEAKVTAAGNNNYMSVTRTVTFRIKVK